MRNLKKVLSLALAMVMLIGMMVVGAGAANYTDASDIKNKEAVAVVSGIEVLLGVDDGSSFNPTGILTRAEAAMVIARLDLGPTAAAALKGNGTNNFSDVSSNHWAIGAIDYCAEQGHILGDGAGKFMPDGKVTGVQFALMLTRLLGYNSKAENVTGSSWATAAAALARRAGLTTGVAANTADMTRDDMAQMVFNALKADMVEYADGTGTIIDLGNGATITTGAKATKVMHKQGEALYTGEKAGSDTSNSVKLCETKFPSLKLDSNSVDDFGRSINEWKVNNNTIATAGNSSATVTYTTKTGATQVGKDLKGLKYADNLKATENGNDVTAVTGSDAIANLTKPGKLVEVYVEDGVVTKVVAVTYTVGTVNSITERNDRTTYNIGGISKTNDEDNTNVILAGAVEKDDVVTFAIANNKMYVYPTTSFDGNQTARKTSSGVTTITVGGDSYTLATGVTSFDDASFTNSADDATYFVDQYGYVVQVKAAEAPATQYAVIAKVATSSSSVTLDNPAGYTVEVRAVLADGTVADYTLATAKTTEDNQYGTTSATGSLVAGSGSNRVLLCDADKLNDLQNTVNGALANKVFGYTTNSDGQMVISNITSASATMAANGTFQMNMGNYKGENSNNNGGVISLFNNSSVFVLYNVDSDGKVSGQMHTGPADLPINKTEGVDGGVAVIKTSSKGSVGTANVVFLKTNAVAETVDYAFVDPDSAVSVLKADGKGSTWQYEGIAADGSAITVTAGDGAVASDKVKMGVYEYDADNVLKTTAKVSVDTAEASGSTAVNAFYHLKDATATSNMLHVGNTWVNIGDANIVYTNDDLYEINHVKCFVVTGDSAGKAATVFVYEKIDTRANAGTVSSKTATVSVGGINEDVFVTKVENADFGIVTSSNSDVATATITTGGTLRITGKAAGEAKISVPVKAGNTETHKDVTLEISVTVNKAAAGEVGAISGNVSTDPKKTATVTVTLADASVTAGDITVAGVTSEDITVAKGAIVNGENGEPNTCVLTVNAVATTAKTSTFTVAIAAHDTANYSDVSAQTITVNIEAASAE